ncbi:DoxX family protein [Dyadobacter sp. OTU695]|uniref:DoxX family protein n=1 Tax=Dyadobacter sp. OTU695 TaxID=3043860 RepID=UPI00313BC314
MKKIKIAYYVATGLLSLAMALSAFAYLTNPAIKVGFQHLGFPDYFRIELGVAKGLAAIALWLPFRLAKDVAYIGLSISFVSAFIAHIAVGDPASVFVNPLIILTILVVSYLTHQKLQVVSDKSQ